MNVTSVVNAFTIKYVHPVMVATHVIIEAAQMLIVTPTPIGVESTATVIEVVHITADFANVIAVAANIK